MTDVWQIKDWGAVFEDYRSREVARLSFLRFPLDRNSEAYKLLVQTPAGVAAYGVFCALMTVAARCPIRGVLADEKGPLTPERLSVRTGMPTKAIRDAIKRLSAPDVGWLEPANVTDGAPTAHRSTTDGPPTKHPPTTDDAPTCHRCGTDRSACACAPTRARTKNTEDNKTEKTHTQTRVRATEPEQIPGGLEAGHPREPKPRQWKSIAFRRFLEAYPPPQCNAKPDLAHREWINRDLDAHAPAVMAGLQAWIECERWAENRYIPNPDRFLAEERWKHAPDAATGASSDSTASAKAILARLAKEAS